MSYNESSIFSQFWKEGSICQHGSFLFLNMQVSYIWGDNNNRVLMDSIQVLENQAAKIVVLDRATHSSSTQALLDLNWMNLSTKRLMQRCFFLCITLLMRGSDYRNDKHPLQGNY